MQQVRGYQVPVIGGISVSLSALSSHDTRTTRVILRMSGARDRWILYSRLDLALYQDNRASFLNFFHYRMRWKQSLFWPGIDTFLLHPLRSLCASWLREPLATVAFNGSSRGTATKGSDLIIVLTGDLDRTSARTKATAAERLRTRRILQAVSIDATQFGRRDSALIVCLWALQPQATKFDVAFGQSGLPQPARRLFVLASLDVTPEAKSTGHDRLRDPVGRRAACSRQIGPFRRGVVMVMALACMSLCRCSGLGTRRLYADQIGYSRALGDAQKSETLLNVVRIRYGDTPTLLQATQVISGYQLQRNVTGGFEAFPAANPATFLNGSASAQLQQSPTFTFQPLSGEEFAQSFIRPLSPSDLLPLATSGLPIDVLFRLGVQSINGLSNAVALTQTGAAGSPDFFLLLQDLRRLQIAGLLGIRVQPNATPVGDRGNSEPGGVILSIASTRDRDLLATANEAKRLLGMPLGETEAEVVYGSSPEPGQVAVLTRSVLGILSQLAIQINVPPDDVERHRTLPTVGNIGSEHRPVVVVHCGAAAPADVFASVRYGRTWFWIAEDDFDSKLAFTVVQILLALARTGNAPGAIVTIPAG
jgi:ABC-type transporter Mla MlaB component